MKAVIYERFDGPLSLSNVKDPEVDSKGAIIKVMANGICRSDWHGWKGHDPTIKLPNVPGHEFSGVVEEVGKEVTQYKKGDRVTAPFVCGCGVCPECHSGNHQVCDNQSQPGFTHWGAFAEYVYIKEADINLVLLPEEIDFITAAGLGCRVGTAYHAITQQGQISLGQWVAVHGCGGLGLSIVMLAHAIGCKVIAIDIHSEALNLAKSLGAQETLNANENQDVVGTIIEKTGRGAHVSFDALGNPMTCLNSLKCLRKRGRHIQVGLLLNEESTPPIPMDLVLANELQLFGSHGIQAHEYPPLLNLIISRKINPKSLVRKTVSLEESIVELKKMDSYEIKGMTIIDKF